MTVSRVLLVHNHYQQYGGEDRVFSTEAALLETHLPYVRRYTVHNDAITTMGHRQLAQATCWNQKVYHEIRHLIQKERIELVHFHNTFPLISPAAYYAARSAGAAIVQTLHNYRLVCPNAFLLRNGQVCTACQGKVLPWPGIVYACYRKSRVATAVLAAMLGGHRLIGTWQKIVDIYIALSEFARAEFIKGGLPPAKIVVKPNFVYPAPAPGPGDGGYALFVGRLSSEKGIETLLAAWERLVAPVPLKIVGDGPLRQQVVDVAHRIAAVEWLGWQPAHEVYALMGAAAFLILPSAWYEGLPHTILESFAKGTPVIAANLGTMRDMVQPGCTGYHFRPGDPDDLARVVTEVATAPDQLAAMRQAARSTFEATYTAEQNYQMLLAIYEAALSQ